jgi:hypothetical protein
MEAAVASASGEFGSPQPAAIARHSRGRIRAPPGKTAYRMAAARRGGQPSVSQEATALSKACSIAEPLSMMATYLSAA